MPRNDDWDDDDDRPRRRRDRDDDYEDDYVDRRLRSTGHSGAVTAVGIINIIVGSLSALLGLCLFLGGAFVGGAANDFRGNPGAGLAGVLAGAILIVAFLILVIAVLEILAGVGVLNRKNWARILTLVLGGLSALGGLLSILPSSPRSTTRLSTTGPPPSSAVWSASCSISATPSWCMSFS